MMRRVSAPRELVALRAIHGESGRDIDAVRVMPEPAGVRR